jgi:hypothetical protein
VVRLDIVSTLAPVSRRTALVGVCGLGARVAGCTSGSPGAAAPSPSASGSTGATGVTPSPAVEPDVLLAATVLDVERAMLERVLATQRRHPRLAGSLAGARAAHRAHVDLLATAVPTDVARPARRRTRSVPASPGAALAALARAEEELAGKDRSSAMAARSGAFARVLASMAAAAEQQAVRVAGAAEDRR